DELRGLVVRVVPIQEREPVAVVLWIVGHDPCSCRSLANHDDWRDAGTDTALNGVGEHGLHDSLLSIELPTGFRCCRGKAARGIFSARNPFHEQIDAFVLDLPEAQTLVEPKRWIEALDVDAQRLARGAPFRLQSLQQRRADSAAAIF